MLVAEPVAERDLVRMAVQVGRWPGTRSVGGRGNGGQRVGAEMLTHVLSGDVPDRQQDALSIVVACSVLMRCAEVAQCDRSIDRRDDLGEANLRRRSCERVSAADSSFGFHQSSTLEREQDLFQVGLGQGSALGDVANRGRTGTFVERERQQGPTRIITPCRNPHTRIVGAGLWQ